MLDEHLLEQALSVCFLFSRVFFPFVDADRFHALCVTSESARTKRTEDFLVFRITIIIYHHRKTYLTIDPTYLYIYVTLVFMYFT